MTKIIVDYFSGQEGLVCVVLFGSYATGTANEKSDSENRGEMS